MSSASEATQFQSGNSLWRSRSSHGRKRLFETPEDLEAACHEYFDWVEANPLMAPEPVKFQGEAKIVKVPKMRAMTIVGLCSYLKIARKTWTEYRARPDFLHIIEQVEETIYCHKFEGAAADLLNPAIIARELGLRSRQEHSQG